MLVRALERRAETINPKHPGDPGLVSLFGFRKSASGVDVTDAVALTYSALFACVKVLAETVASVPAITYQRQQAGRRRASEHPLSRLLHSRPNPEMTSAEWHETMMGWVGLRGNGLSEIVPDGSGQVRELWPLRPDHTRLTRRNGRLWYLIRMPNGETRALMRSQVFHVKGLGSNGLWGYSPVDQAREAIGMGIAAREYGARFFANDGSPRGALKLEGKLEDPVKDGRRLRETWGDIHEGLENKHRVAILEQGTSWQEIGVSPDTAQFLETRKFEVREIARWYRMQPHMIQDLEQATFSNITEQSLEFVKYTMLPWFRKWEQAIDSDLFLQSDREAGYFTEYMLEGLLRADPKTRGEFYKSLWQIGAMNADEIRERENLNPQPDERGSVYYVPLNVMPAGRPGDSPGEDDGGGERTRIDRIERRQMQQAGEGRRRIAAAFEPMFAAVGLRLVRSERREVMKQAQRLGAAGLQDLVLWLDAFYREHEEFAAGLLRPPFASLAPLLVEEARELAGLESLAPGMTDELVEGLAQVSGKRHAASSRGQLRELLTRRTEDPIEALEERFGEWEEKRPAKIGRRETVEASGAVSKAVFAAAGIIRLQWVAFGESCPFCEGLDGRIVGIQESFATKGQLVEAEGREPLRVRSDISYPPIHGGCLPGDARISAEGVTASSERWYDGDLVIVSTAADQQLTCTPNHPVLTDRGWIPAGLLDEGDHVVRSRAADRHAPIVGHHQDVPACIEEVAKTFCTPGEMRSAPMPGSAEDFHGDGVDGEITVIRANRLLLDAGETARFEKAGELAFRVRDSDASLFSGLGGALQLVSRRLPARGCPMCGGDLPGTLSRAALRPDNALRAPAVSNIDSGFRQRPSDRPARHAKPPRQRVLTFPGEIALDDVIAVERKPFHGYVYNLQTRHGYYVAGGLIVHNCDCQIVPA